MEKTILEKNGTQFANMGLSLVARLQQNQFFDYEKRNYYARMLGAKMLIYKETAKPSRVRQLSEEQLTALQGVKFKGNLSTRSQKKIISILQNWQDTLDYINRKNKKNSKDDTNQLVMITLTLSSKQIHSDQEIKRKMLNRFIVEMMRQVTFVNYLWKAETQENGNIHFHIIVDRYWQKEEIQLLWNKIQVDNGYHPFASLDSKNLGLPSTRIEALKNKSDSISYLAKYIQKNEGRRAIEGRIWGCSRYLSKLEPLTVKLSSDDVKTIIKETTLFEHQIFINNYAVILSNTYKIAQLKEYIFEMNSTNVLKMEKNIELLNSRALTVDFELRMTDWYNEVCEEYGVMHSEYCLANNLFAGVQPLCV